MDEPDIVDLDYSSREGAVIQKLLWKSKRHVIPCGSEEVHPKLCLSCSSMKSKMEIVIQSCFRVLPVKQLLSVMRA